MRILPAHDKEATVAATAALDAGELVIVPCDLRYFVVADALDDEAVDRLFVATQRGADRPLTVIVSGYEDLHHVAYGGAGARELAEKHWPGPTVISVKPRPWIPDTVTAGHAALRTMAPRSEVTRTLARGFGPLAAAGARVQGQLDSLDATSAAARLGGSIAVTLDGGTLPGGEEAYVLAQGST